MQETSHLHASIVKNYLLIKQSCENMNGYTVVKSRSLVSIVRNRFLKGRVGRKFTQSYTILPLYFIHKKDCGFGYNCMLPIHDIDRNYIPR